MKKLVLGALLAIGSSVGCVAANDSRVTVTWQFEHLATKTISPTCPAGFDTATIVSQPWDPDANVLLGSPKLDLFDCSRMTGTVRLPFDTYLVWVQIENHDGSQIFSKSAQTFVDTVIGDAVVDTSFLDDGGFFFLTWDLVDATTHAPLSCKAAGVGTNGSVEVAASSVAHPSDPPLIDKFTCEAGFGTSAPLLQGQYGLHINALDSHDTPLGDGFATTTKTIVPEGLTDLGHILIPID